MTQFEFVMMVAAVVIALGLSQIVGGWGLLLRANEREIRFDWLHLGMSIMIAMGMLQYWVGMWAYEPIELKYGFQVALLVVPSFFLVIAAYAISPDPELLGKNSCRHYYMSRRAAIFLPLAFASLLSVIADGAIAGFDEPTPAVWLVFGVGSAQTIALALSQRVWLHAAVLILGIVQICVFFLAAELLDINQRLIDQTDLVQAGEQSEKHRNAYR